MLVEGGSLVVNAPWILHRHGRFWTSPGRFDPSRFLSGAPQWPRFGYMPFGVGPQACVGTPFALTELMLVLATLVRRFRFVLAPHRPVKRVGLVTV